jgi:type II secretory pathway predicted ATPase ExeA
MSRLEVFAEYGFKRDPFSSCFIETADIARIKASISLALSSDSRQRAVAILAETGAGKTTAIRHTLASMDVRAVQAERSNKERMTIDNIEYDLIAGVTDEPVRRDSNTRKRQLRRVLGEAVKRRPVVLIIEEAHRIHAQTLVALKTLMEMEWAGVCPLFTPVLVGQYDPTHKKGVREMGLRSDPISMKGLSTGEAREYVQATVGEHFEPDAIEAFSRLDAARNFLECQEALVAVMEKALATGSKRVTALEIFDVYGGGLREVLRRINMTEGDISRETEIPRSVVSSIVNDKQRTLSDENFRKSREAITTVLRRRMEGPGKEKAAAAAADSGLRAL